jgi:ribosome-binding factor A
MASDRMRRVDEAVREVLSAAIAEGLKDPRIGFVTITAVKTSPDLRTARVYVSVLGEPASQVGSVDGLQSAAGHLQRRLGDELAMKRTPTLRFQLDDTSERAVRLTRLIDEQTGGAGDEEPGA